MLLSQHFGLLKGDLSKTGNVLQQVCLTLLTNWLMKVDLWNPSELWQGRGRLEQLALRLAAKSERHQPAKQSYHIPENN